MIMQKFTAATLTQPEFELLSGYIYTHYGIKMPLAKKTLLQCRLQKRLRVLNMERFDQYIDYVFSQEGVEKELQHMTDVVTTNKTDFFREPAHFEFLQQLNWADFMGGEPAGKVVKAWSAACSTGEEPYTLAMVLQELKLAYQILASDLSVEVLQKAATAVYASDKTAPVPQLLKQKYLLRHKDPKNPLTRIVPELRKKVSVKHLNLMDDHYDVQGKFDLIFCRNVLIYFDRKTQEQVIRKLCAHLREGGYLFIGHSESLTDLRLPLLPVKSTIFQKRG
ncbi:CheR family methyltransferase [Cesiribacter andamanensis]|uniref:protein-glutamate O-methyltransferase n=1 Tax=Cesiribacter andamanensis AMV16 TaxID=1279009 RepID=M7NQI2_9BACT|nr:CheR family methyltransferase [Cesiribacter andamanensis]EMR03985.1 Chemotaxis protein methyltransferase [Cesiribacter andamanensis AMV16]